MITYLDNIIAEYAGKALKTLPESVVSFRKLFRPRLNLQLLQYSEDQLEKRVNLKTETDKLYKELDPILQEVQHMIPAVHDFTLKEPELRLINQELASFVHEHFHYLLSSRIGIFHFGLYVKSEQSGKEQIIALATFSHNDLTHLYGLLPEDITPDQVLVLSRFITFDWAPFNTASFMLSKISEWFRNHQPDVQMVLSYLDPNAGYTGGIYRAINARLFGLEQKARYLYLDRRYVSDRAMIALYGTADYSILKQKLGLKIQKSKAELFPLKIFCWFPNEALHRRYQSDFNHIILPLKTLVG